MKLKSLLLILFMTCSMVDMFGERIAAMPPIMGPINVCTGETYTYIVANNPSIYYEWTITGGALLSSPTGSNIVTAVWYTSGSISVTGYSDPLLTAAVYNVSLAVTVDVLAPYITSDPEVGCVVVEKDNRDIDNCQKACLDNPITYFSNGSAGSNFQWQVTGSAVILSMTSSQLDIQWNAVGQGKVILTEISPNGCEEETEICIDIIDKPKALFNPRQGTTICLNQELIFEDLSLAIGTSALVAWEWRISDGTFKAYTESKNFKHTFLSPGTFDVDLKVFNSCGCYDIYSVSIDVLPDVGPDIVCPKVVCPNEKMEIYTNDPCGVYNWNVVNGTIVMGHGSDRITVMWNDDPSGVGYVELSTPCGPCPVATVLEVPIVSTSLYVSGPIEACIGDQVTLTVAQLPGTFYTWSVVTGNAFVVEQIHNEAVIDIFGAGLVQVQVDYYNELGNCGLGCKGSSTHSLITVLPSGVAGVEEVCLGDSEPYSITGPTGFDIRVEDPFGGATVITDGATFTFNQVGTYLLTPDGAGCQDPALVVTCHDIPVAPDFINGPTEVCAGIPYVYTGGLDVDGTIYSWIVSGGTPATGSGKEIAITWTAGSTWALSLRREGVEKPHCQSPDIDILIDPIQVNPSMSGNTTVCANSEHPYALDYNDGEEYKWSISPQTAGSVKGSLDNQSVSIQWNNTSGTAVITGSVRKCNTWYPVTKTVQINPISQVSFTASSTTICQNQSISFAATTGFANYKWNISPTIGTPPGNTPSFSKTFPQAGTYNISLVATDNCGIFSNYSVQVNVLPEPPAQLSLSANNMVCDTSGNVISGSATLVTSIIGGASGHNFAWTRNTVPVGGNTTSLTVTTMGTYQCIVTNIATGCTAVKTIILSCPSAPPCTMPSANTGTFSFGYDNMNCGEVKFFENGPITTAPGWSLISRKYEHNLSPNIFSQPGPSYTYASFDQAGYYNVGYELCFNHPTQGTCCTTIPKTVPIPVVAEASATVYCNSAGSYMLKLDDFSSKVGNLATYNATWVVDGISYPVGNTTDASTTMPLPGTLTPGNTYSIVLKVSVPMAAVPGMTGPYQCEIGTSVNIPALPNALFTHNAPLCEDLAVDFTTSPNGSNTKYDWAFGDGSQLILGVGNASRKYAAPQTGGYNVTLTVTNSVGCVDTDSTNLNVEANNFVNAVINVSPSTPICTPNPATLTFSHTGSTSATSYAWSDGTIANPDIVFDAGGYLVKATDIYGCATTTNLTPVDIRPSPMAVVYGDNSYCETSNLEVKLSGYAGAGYQYQWKKRDAINTAWTINGTTPYINDFGSTVSNSPYDYELLVTDPATGCSSSSIFPVVIHALPPAPMVNTSVVNCDPLIIQLDANSSVSPAYYNWSDGQVGPSVNVMHGGNYEVTLTDGNGCRNLVDFPVKGEPDFDFFPAGCYTYCQDDLPLDFAGPYGNYDYWELIHNGGTLASGTGPISGLQVVTGGQYYLYVHDQGCDYKSEILDVTIDYDKCPHECEDRCSITLDKIKPNQLLDCLYEFNIKAVAGPCTQITSYNWTVNGNPVPGGANMSYLFPGAGGTYNICVTVEGIDRNGVICRETTCIKFKPTCGCECGITADFTWKQDGCDFKFKQTSTVNECTEFEDVYWTMSSGGNIFHTGVGNTFGYSFGGNKPIVVCLTAYGNQGNVACSDKICKTIYPCPKGEERSFLDTSKPFENGEYFSVNPNPFLDRISIHGTDLAGSQWDLQVIDFKGSLIHSMKQEVPNSLLEISTELWTDGLYQVIVRDENGNLFIDKIIKVSN